MLAKATRKGSAGLARKAAGATVRDDAAERISLGHLEDSVGFHLRAAQEAAFRAFVRRLGDASTPPWRYGILVLIDANAGLTQVELASATGRDTSSLTPALDDLCGRGLVTRTRRENDRRSYALHLTPLGRKTMREMKGAAEAHERDLDRLVGRGNRTQFVEALKRIAAGLELDE